MAVLITVNENSYISVDDADTYFNDRLYSDTWTSASEDNKARALIMACKNIEKQFFKGIKKVEGQILAFPRCYVVDKRNDYNLLINRPINLTKYEPYINCYSIWNCEEEVTQNVKEAQCEEAITLLERGNSQRRKLQHEGVSNFSLGGMSENYKDGAGRGLLSQESKELLRPYLAGAVSIV